MSLINKVLQDLDQRSAMSAPDSAPPPRQVRVVPPAKGGREWFWGVVGALMLVALSWVGWIAWQLQPRPLATNLAFQAAEQANQKKQALTSRGTLQPAPAEKPPAPAEKAASLPEKPAAEAKAPTELFKLAPSIDTPIAAAGPNAGVTAQKPAAPAKPKTDKPIALAPAPAIAAKPPALASKLEKHEQPRSSADRAEAEYRRGAALLNQGRVSEAEASLSAAIAADPAHEPARQALVALYIEQRRSQEASRLLQQGLALNPAQVRFAIVLARLHAERGDHAAALDILNRVKPSAGDDAEFNSLLGGVLQRLKRHTEAADAYRAAVQVVPHSGISWVGLGISLEALARRPEAAEAFRRAVATGTLTAEVKGYAEQRARALH
jgi:MSHA biogenesis protein MshN